MPLIRLTEITDQRGDVETLVNTDYIRRIEAFEDVDRCKLRLWLSGETRTRDFVAVDISGRNKVTDKESAEDLLDQFRMYLKR